MHLYGVLLKAIEESKLTITTVLSGGARGVDSLGEKWAEHRKLSLERYPADWASYGLAAGPLRNQAMVDKAEQALLVWNGFSSGTRDLLQRVQRKGLPVFVFYYD